MHDSSKHPAQPATTMPCTEHSSHQPGMQMHMPRLQPPSSTAMHPRQKATWLKSTEHWWCTTVLSTPVENILRKNAWMGQGAQTSSSSSRRCKSHAYSTEPIKQAWPHQTRLPQLLPGTPLIQMQSPSEREQAHQSMQLQLPGGHLLPGCIQHRQHLPQAPVKNPSRASFDWCAQPTALSRGHRSSCAAHPRPHNAAHESAGGCAVSAAVCQAVASHQASKGSLLSERC